MTKKKTTKKAAPVEELPKYVVLHRMSYKSMLPEREIIEVADDPYAPEARRVDFPHLSKADVNKLLMRKAIALAPEEIEPNSDITEQE